jgi:hypothetical protein
VKRQKWSKCIIGVSKLVLYEIYIKPLPKILFQFI